MGIHYGIGLAIGFTIRLEEFLKPFAKTREEEFHIEDRWDPKTGKKLEPVKVVDDEGDEWYEYGAASMDEEELMEAVGNNFKCNINYIGDCEASEAVLEITLDDVVYTSEDDYDDGRVSIGCSMKFEELVALQSRLRSTKQAFEEIGIVLGEPKVMCSYSIG